MRNCLHGLRYRRCNCRDKRYTPRKLPPSLPRIGLELVLPGEFTQVSWFGRGPGESYRDSKLANKFGLYSKEVSELHTPYVYPQENGNRTDVKWVSITNLRGVGLFAAGSPLELQRP